ncbi:MAG: Gfo/Idh/MocA family oxidoreductase [Propionibacteriaceae bacterium]|jgi:predicted dehydrogenase|nr:Gfo/Idh/MocA family oxidoreductase [Propionibacteriaceae bacterium]
MTLLPLPRIPDPLEAPAIRWGILGAGGIATAFATAVSAFTRSQLVAVGSRDADRGQAFASRFGIPKVYQSYDELVADAEVDAIYVATPHSHHLQHALLAITAGKHVLVEKAFARNAAEAGLIVGAARSANVTVMEAMWTRFLPRTDIVRQLLQSGELGEIITLIADHGQALTHVPRLMQPDLAGGALLDLGIYPVSWTVFALGMPTQIVAQAVPTETGVDGQITILLSGFQNHPRAHAVLTTTLWAQTPTTASLSGTKASVELTGTPFYQPGPVTLVDADLVRTESAPSKLVAHQGLAYEAAHFAELVVGGQTESPLLPLDESVGILAILDEARRQIGFKLPGE